MGWLRGSGLGDSARDERWAAVAFAVAVVIAVPLIFHQGRDQWFFYDEWNYLVGRGVGFDDLMQPYNEHWATIPILTYRGLYSLVGIRSYLPYQAFVIGYHVVAVALLRVVMRRGGVAPWIATVAAGALLVFGSGRQDIVWAFQIHFTGSLAFGLAHLLCADHEGETDWRDLAGLAFGLAGLMSSLIGPVMVGVVGLAMVARRGWKVAALHVVPLAVVFLTWWWSFGRGAYHEPAGVRGAVEFAWDGVVESVGRIGQTPVAALVLVVAFVAGLALAARPDPAGAVRTAALSLSLAAGAVALVLMTGFTRAGRGGNDVPGATRYVYLTAALLFPTLAIAIDALWKRARVLGLVALAALVAGIPGNVEAFRPHGLEIYMLGSPEIIETAAHLPAMRRLPAERHPFGLFEGVVTAGWLNDAVAQGKVAASPEVSAEMKAAVTLQIVLARVPGQLGPECQPLTGPVELSVDAGDTFSIVGGPAMISLRLDGAASPPVEYPANSRLRAEGTPLDLEVSPPGPGAQTKLCN